MGVSSRFAYTSRRPAGTLVLVVRQAVSLSCAKPNHDTLTGWRTYDEESHSKNSICADE